MRLLVLTGLLWGMLGQVQAACLLPSFSGVAATQTFVGGGSGYNAFDTATYTQTVTFTVNSLVNVGTCSYFVVLAAGTGGNSLARVMRQGATNLGYVAYATGSQPLLAEGAAGAGNVIAHSFGQVIGLTQSRNHSFTWTVPPLQVVPHAAGGYYTDASVQLELYEGTVAGTHTRVATAPITFRTVVASSVDVAVVGSGGAFALGSTSRNVDFGTPTTGAVRDFDVSIRTNDGYRLTMASANRQVLRRVVPGTTSPTLPYSLSVNNVPTDLTSGAAVAIGTLNGVSGVNGSNLPVRVTLGTLTGLEPAGTYRDTLTLTVSAF